MAGKLIGILALAVALVATRASAAAEMRYPDWQGQWRNQADQGDGPWDPTKPKGLAQNAPLTPAAQAVFEASLKDQAAGGHGNDRSSACTLAGMPRMMNLAAPMEIYIRPGTTTLLFQKGLPRHIYTDGRDWPDEAATFQGYSIGRWIDQDGDGTYDVLEVETRNFEGPRAMDSSGLPLDTDNETIVKERLTLDKADRNLLHDEITTIDHAFTRPWTVVKSYQRVSVPVFGEYNCAVDPSHVFIGSEEYLIGSDGKLAPTHPGQKPPALDYFK